VDTERHDGHTESRVDALNRVLEQRDLNESGRAIGPRIITSGQVLDGPFPTWPWGVAVRSAEDARRLVDEQQAAHADFIKVYGLLSREAFFAVMDQAKLRKIPVTGHVPLAVTAKEASDAGMKSMEHLYAVLYDVSSRGADLNRRSAANAQRFTDERSRTPKDPHLDHIAPFMQMEIEAAQTYDTRIAAQLFATLKKNGTWQVPTLVAKRDWAYEDDTSYRSDRRNQYLPNDRPRFMSTLLKPEEMAAYKKAVVQELTIVRDLYRAGVGLLAGTDGPPFWLVDELEMFVKAGLTPVEALKTATINPAIFLGRESDFGSIDQGRLADLVLLEANPLQDIGSLRRIHAVIFNGKPYSRTDLDAMLTDVTTRAAAARAKPKGD
jgi:Amidohydrolase family